MTIYVKRTNRERHALNPTFSGFPQNINGLLSPVYANVVCPCIVRGCPRWSGLNGGSGFRIIRGNFRRDKADLQSLIPTALLSLQGLAVTLPKHLTFRAGGDAPVLPLVKKNGKTLISRLSLSE